MIKSIDEFKKLEVVVLKAVHEHSSEFGDYLDIEPISMYDVVKELYDQGYITGVNTIEISGTKLEIKTESLRLTKSGLEWLSKIKLKDVLNRDY